MYVMRLLLFVLHVCILGECEGAMVMAMLVWVYGWYTWFWFSVYCRRCARHECGAWGEKCRWSVLHVYVFGSEQVRMCGVRGYGKNRRSV